MSWVATRQDLERYFPASACVPDSRQIAGIYLSGSTFELVGHGFYGGEPVRLAARAGGTLPAAIDPLVWYTVAPAPSRDFFALVGVTLADIGAGIIFALEDFGPKIDRILLECTSYLVARAKAYAGPWTTPPDWAPRTVAHLAAPEVAAVLRLSPDRYDVEGVKARAAIAEAFCQELNQGQPMGDGVGPVDATPAVAEMGPRLTASPLGPFRAPRHPLGCGNLSRNRDRV